MRLSPHFKVNGTGRAAFGRRLAWRAVFIELILVFLIFAIWGRVLFLYPDAVPIAASIFVVWIAVLIAILWAISNEKLWIGLIYAAYCVFSIIWTFGLSSSTILTVIFELSITAIRFAGVCGVVIWLHNRTPKHAAI